MKQQVFTLYDDGTGVFYVNKNEHFPLFWYRHGDNVKLSPVGHEQMALWVEGLPNAH